MRTADGFMNEGSWYKGNLHCHSTLSDGDLTTDQLRAAYKEKGYHFLAHSEHDFFSNFEDQNEADFITLPSSEVGIRMPAGDYRIFHLHVILGTDDHIRNATREPLKHMEPIKWEDFKDFSTAQAFIDDMVARGNIVMFNHPHWSIVEWQDLIELDNLFAIEIYNHCSEWQENMGNAKILWDSLLRRGKRLYGTATDDNHNRIPLDSPYNDSFGGWVVVKAKELSRNAIIEALLQGSFYSSTGPEIYDFRIVDDEVIFECSPVQRIYMNGDRHQYQIEIGENVTQLRKKLQGTEKYIRIECIDKYGKSAYTNPIYLD
ncbi:CehA/McbA family metallohydrolase [Paenibacillus mendelii]|uniref:CehA/McbA family metallohydrolase n=1 Tax=Paenibacillus mendelii TaxID=206163 RepID=A0ABV6JBU3_9BACL|nr:CehA/McbA family metallohydrolase [Paenibacillus mendelii]MCQ6562633.1 CehA/McbA family metallohydrolase [Paenibacillus mendelii]